MRKLSVFVILISVIFLLGCAEEESGNTTVTGSNIASSLAICKDAALQCSVDKATTTGFTCDYCADKCGGVGYSKDPRKYWDSVAACRAGEPSYITSIEFKVEFVIESCNGEQVMIRNTGDLTLDELADIYDLEGNNVAYIDFKTTHVGPKMILWVDIMPLADKNDYIYPLSGQYKVIDPSYPTYEFSC